MRRQFTAPSIDEQKAAIYLRLIAEATEMLSKNQGNQLDDIWGFIERTHGMIEDTVDYDDFCNSVDILLE